MQDIPRYHPGIAYLDFVPQLSIKRNVKRYLEIGVEEGILMSKVTADVAIGVDPSFKINQDITKNKKSTILISETSDEFFKNHDFLSLAKGAPDLCFLDGLHTFDCLLRDFMNTEAICSRTSLICMHDCLPLDDIMAIRHLDVWATSERSPEYSEYWTGDVWKIIPILQRYRPDLKLVYVDSPPTGLVFATGLDPSSSKLRDAYLDIVQEYLAVSNNLVELEKLYRSIEMTSSTAVLREFDNTLFFKA